MQPDRLYYTDAYLTRCEARVLTRDDSVLRVVLDQTVFYPTSGGQPHDAGTLGGVRVLSVEETEDGTVVHTLAQALDSDTVTAAIDWDRRFDHMQQHTGQHLLSAVLAERYGLHTVSFHLGEEVSTIDVSDPTLSADRLPEFERSVNEQVFANLPVRVSFEDAEAAAGLRKASERAGTLRIVSIEGLDRSACGGTHVRSTGEIGPILLRRIDRVRQTTRLEFLCGGRAVRQARQDYEWLKAAAQVFSAAPAQLPDLVSTQAEKSRDQEKQLRALRTEVGQMRGRQQYQETAPDAHGVRRAVVTVPAGPIPDEVRAQAQAFTAQPQALFVAAAVENGSLLLGVSADAGVHAGNRLKAALQAVGGRGGGSATLAQGSVARPEDLGAVLAALP